MAIPKERPALWLPLLTHMKTPVKLDRDANAPLHVVPQAPPRAVLKHFAQSPARAAHDAVRAWIIYPIFFARRKSELQKDGACELTSLRRYRIGERLRVKFLVAGYTFWHGLKLRMARTVCIPRLGGEGLMANLLHVLEVLHRVRPDADVHVDWALDGSEEGFRYGRVGENVWTGLFRMLGAKPRGRYFRAASSVDSALWGTGKDYLKGRALKRHRDAYSRTLAKWVEIANLRVLEEVGSISEQSLSGRFCIGIHRRVGNQLVLNVQRDGAVPSIERLVECVHAEVRSRAAADWVVFLATDDANAALILRQELGPRLVVRDHIRRTTDDEAEVHYSDWGKLSLADAEDVLIDTLLLARCDVLLHASSSVSTMVGLLNPALRLVRVVQAGEPGEFSERRML